MAQLAWHTSVSILVAGGMVAGAVYFALRPSPSPTPMGESPTEIAVQPSNRPAAIAAMAERDRQRRWDEWEANENSPTPDPQIRAQRDENISEAQQAMAVAQPLAVPPVPQALNERVQQDAGEAFEAVRGRVRTECWDAQPNDPEAPDSVSVLLSLSYDANGKVLASGITEDRERNRAGLAACLGPLVHELDIPAPGTNLSIELSVAIP